jgi:hypothetical protein
MKQIINFKKFLTFYPVEYPVVFYGNGNYVMWAIESIKQDITYFLYKVS